MAMIITVANEKGGVAKTTASCELALLAQHNGYTTVLIDTDHQQGATKFKLRRDQVSAELPPLRVVPIVGKSVGSQIVDFARENDIVVVDAGGRDSQEMRLAMLVSHLVLIPTSEGDADTDGLNKMAMLINESRLRNPELKAWIMPARIPPTNFGATRALIEEELNKPIDPSVPNERIRDVLGTVTRCFLVQRSAYKTAYGWGRSVREMDGRDPKAASEVQAFYQEVVDHG